MPDTVVTLTIAGADEAARYGRAARIPRIAPISLSSMSACHTASSASRNGPEALLPALLIRISRPPKASMVRSTAAAGPSALAMSATMVIGRWPVSALMRSAANCSCSARRATSTTMAPSSARRSAVSKPIPWLAPVTNATLLVSAMSIRLLLMSTSRDDIRHVDVMYARVYIVIQHAYIW